MVNQIIILLSAGLISLLSNAILQYFVLRSRIKKLEKDWPTLRHLISIYSFKNYLDVISAEKAQELLEEILVSLRVLPSLDSITSEVEEKLSSVKYGLRALLDSLELVEILNESFTNIKRNYEIGSVMAYVSFVVFLLSLFYIKSSYFSLFYGFSLGLGINSLFLLISTWININKIQRVKSKLKQILK